MRNIVLLVVALCVCIVASMPIDEEFNNFAVKYNKQYAPHEVPLRQSIFRENLKKIEAHNKKGSSTFQLGITEFADMTNEEFVKTRLSKHSPYMNDGEEIDVGGQAPPASLDWRTNTNPTVVNPVRSMGQCLDPTAVAIVDSISSDYAVSSKQDVWQFDTSYVTDCDGLGCKGGPDTTIWNFISKYGLSWYYTAGVCPTGPGVGLCISGYNCSTAGSESTLQNVVATHGPVPIEIDASKSSFQLYTSGVYYEPACSSSNLNFAMLLVGYGTTSSGQDYWIARNAWGTNWGQKGDIFLARNKNNNCGVATRACYAKTVKTCVCSI